MAAIKITSGGEPALDPELIKDIEAMFDGMGGYDGFKKGMDEFHQAVTRMFAEREALTEEYPNKWVAMGKDGVLAVEDSLDDLFEELESRGLRDQKMKVEFLDPDPLPLLL